MNNGAAVYSPQMSPSAVRTQLSPTVLAGEWPASAKSGASSPSPTWSAPGEKNTASHPSSPVNGGNSNSLHFNTRSPPVSNLMGGIPVDTRSVLDRQQRGSDGSRPGSGLNGHRTESSFYADESGSSLQQPQHHRQAKAWKKAASTGPSLKEIQQEETRQSAAAVREHEKAMAEMLRLETLSLSQQQQKYAGTGSGGWAATAATGAGAPPSTLASIMAQEAADAASRGHMKPSAADLMSSAPSRNPPGGWSRVAATGQPPKNEWHVVSGTRPAKPPRYINQVTILVLDLYEQPRHRRLW